MKKSRFYVLNKIYAVILKPLQHADYQYIYKISIYYDLLSVPVTLITNVTFGLPGLY